MAVLTPSATTTAVSPVLALIAKVALAHAIEKLNAAGRCRAFADWLDAARTSVETLPADAREYGFVEEEGRPVFYWWMAADRDALFYAYAQGRAFRIAIADAFDAPDIQVYTWAGPKPHLWVGGLRDLEISAPLDSFAAAS